MYYLSNPFEAGVGVLDSRSCRALLTAPASDDAGERLRQRITPTPDSFKAPQLAACLIPKALTLTLAAIDPQP